MELPDRDSTREQRPPLGSWAAVYALVVAWLLAVWAFLAWLTSFDVPVGGP